MTDIAQQVSDLAALLDGRGLLSTCLHRQTARALAKLHVDVVALQDIIAELRDGRDSQICDAVADSLIEITELTAERDAARGIVETLRREAEEARIRLTVSQAKHQTFGRAHRSQNLSTVKQLIEQRNALSVELEAANQAEIILRRQHSWRSYPDEAPTRRDAYVCIHTDGRKAVRVFAPTVCDSSETDPWGAVVRWAHLPADG